MVARMSASEGFHCSDGLTTQKAIYSLHIYRWSTLPRRRRQGGSALIFIQDDNNAVLHHDIRYSWSTCNKVLALIYLQNDQWQGEEHPQGFPFDSGYLTTVKIVPSSEASAYKIYANGLHITDFKYCSGGTPDKVKRVSEDISQPVKVTQLMMMK